MDSTQTFQVYNRGPGPAARLVFFAVLSLLLMFVDAHFRYLESARNALAVLVSPVQRLAALPGLIMHQGADYLVSQQALQQENQGMHRQHELDAAQLVQCKSVVQENQQLRNLMAVQQRREVGAAICRDSLCRTRYLPAQDTGTKRQHGPYSGRSDRHG